MKFTVGELILTIVTVVGIGLIGYGVYQYAPTMQTKINAYMDSFFSISTNYTKK